MTASPRLVVEIDPAHPEGGHAVLLLHGLAEAAVPAESAPPPDLTIRRGGAVDTVLGPDGWQGSDVAVRPDAMGRQGKTLHLFLGPAIVNPLAGEPGVEIEVIGLAPPQRLRWPEIPPLDGTGTGNRVDAAARQKARRSDLTGTGRARATLAPEPPPEPEPPSAIPLEAADEHRTALRAASPSVHSVPPKGRGPLIAALALLLALAIGLAAWWWFEFRQTDEPAVESEAPLSPDPEPEIEPEAEPEAPTPEPPPADEEDAAEDATAPSLPVAPPPDPAPAPPLQPAPDPASVPSLLDRLRSMQDGREAYRFGQELLEDGDPDSALLAFERAQALDHAPGITAQGRMYDPGLWAPDRSAFSQPYADRAAQLYRDAEAAGDREAAALLENLIAALQAAATAGDAAAAELLEALVADPDPNANGDVDGGAMPGFSPDPPAQP